MRAPECIIKSLRGFEMRRQITTEQVLTEDYEISLVGLASSFFVRDNAGSHVMEHEMFHLWSCGDQKKTGQDQRR